MVMVGGGWGGRGGGLVRMVSPGGDGGGGGHTLDPISGEIRLASRVPVLGARVPVGRPLRPIQICAVCLYTSLLGGDAGTGMT
jgi:hypothetical protein